jgi:hypothetical protein
MGNAVATSNPFVRVVGVPEKGTSSDPWLTPIPELTLSLVFNPMSFPNIDGLAIELHPAQTRLLGRQNSKPHPALNSEAPFPRTASSVAPRRRVPLQALRAAPSLLS